MAAREAVYATATALKSNLQTKLDAMSTETGERVPVIAEFRDIFTDDDPSGIGRPLILTALDVVGTEEGEFEAFSKYDTRVPLVVEYRTTDPDSAKARATASYVFRGIMQCLNDVTSSTRNGVQLIQYLGPRLTIGVDADNNVGLELRFEAQMRDTSP